jgi:hypothetical protein
MCGGVAAAHDKFCHCDEWRSHEEAIYGITHLLMGWIKRFQRLIYRVFSASLHGI